MPTDAGSEVAVIYDLPEQTPLTVFLLGEDPATESDLCEYLWSHPGFDLAAAHYDARSAIRIVEALQPNIVLVHIGSEDAERLTFIEACRTLNSECLILVCFSRSGSSLRKPALLAGVHGELPDIEDATLCHYLLSEAAKYFDLRTQQVKLQASRLTELQADFAEAQERLFDYSATIDLSPIEREIARYLALGKSISEIANHLSLSPKRISMHRGRLRQSLCCRTNLELNMVLAKYLPG